METIVRSLCHSGGWHLNDHNEHCIRKPFPRHLHWWQGECQDDRWSHEDADAHPALYGSWPHRPWGTFSLTHCIYWVYYCILSYIPVTSWYILLYTRLSLSTLQSTTPKQAPVCAVPLVPLFLAGNSTPTIPHMFAKRKDACFPFGCADAAAVDGRRGSNIYQVNSWLWSFGRGKPRLGGLSIVQTHERYDATASEARRKRAAEPKRVRKTAPAWFEVKGGISKYIAWCACYIHNLFPANLFFSLLAAG